MPPVFDASRIAAASARYVKPQTFNPSYGTAGFRAEASLLPSTVFRCGLLTAARAIVVGQSCGIMVTASHNPEHDNGVKIVEPSGEMLTQVRTLAGLRAACCMRALTEVQGGAPCLDSAAQTPGRRHGSLAPKLAQTRTKPCCQGCWGGRTNIYRQLWSDDRRPGSRLPQSWRKHRRMRRLRS